MLLSAFNAYVPWDVGLFDQGIMYLRSMMGTAFNIGIWIFMILASIHVVIRLVNFVGR